MTICCPKSINALAMRLTRTDVCGVPEAESVANSRIETDGFITVSLSPNLDTGTEITVKKANGQLCVTNKLPDQLKWLDVTMSLCGIPLPALEMLLGVTALTDGSDTVGGVLPSRDQGGLAYVQMELWSLNKDEDACAGGGTWPYVHWVFPLAHNWQLSGSLDFGDQETTIELSGIVEQTAGYEPSIATEWSEGQITAIQAGGPMAWKCVDALPSNLDECAYVPVASGS